MKVGIVFSVLMMWFTSSAANEFSEYDTKMQQRAESLVALYLGSDVVVTEVSPAPSGLYEVRFVLDGQQMNAYMLPDKEHLIVGSLLSSTSVIDTNTPASNKNRDVARQVEAYRNALFKPRKTGVFSKKDAEKQIPETPASGEENEPHFRHDTEENAVEMSAFHYVKMSEGAVPVYVFIDMNCPTCLKTKPHIEQLAQTNDIELRYVPVGFLNDDSEKKAMFVLTRDDNDQRIAILSQLYQARSLHESGLYEGDQTLINTGFERFKENTLGFYRLPNPATPLFAFKDASGSLTMQATGNLDSIEKLVLQAAGQNMYD